jgi:phenylacetate-CoA ligase
MLFGYPSSLALIAQFATEQRIAMDGLGIRVAFVTSERLYEHQREAIEQTFGCRVANGYGGRDAGFIAHACPQGNLHITAEDMVVEIIDPAGNVLPPGESGEIVVTHLFTSEFPFVRYRTGDVGILSNEPCACGRGLPVLASVEGRTTDFVVAADGTILHGLALIYVLRDMAGVEEFRIVQESLVHTRVEIVTGGAGNDKLGAIIQESFRRRLGQEVEVTVDFLESIPRDQSGKFRYVMSKVPR